MRKIFLGFWAYSILISGLYLLRGFFLSIRNLEMLNNWESFFLFIAMFGSMIIFILYFFANKEYNKIMAFEHNEIRILFSQERHYCNIYFKPDLRSSKFYNQFFHLILRSSITTFAIFILIAILVFFVQSLSLNLVVSNLIFSKLILFFILIFLVYLLYLFHTRYSHLLIYRISSDLNADKLDMNMTFLPFTKKIEFIGDEIKIHHVDEIGFMMTKIIKGVYFETKTIDLKDKTSIYNAKKQLMKYLENHGIEVVDHEIT